MRNVAVVLALVVSIATLFAGVTGVLGRGGDANAYVAWPTLVTGLMSLATVVGFWKKAKWSLALGVTAFMGHIVSHAMVLTRPGTGEATPGKLVGLFAVPAVWIVLVVTLGRRPKERTT